MAIQSTNLTKERVNSVDAMMEILKRLPVKTLIRFLSVSKFWDSIIRSRGFMKLFLNESLTKPRGLIFILKQKYNKGLAFSSNPLITTYEVSSSSLVTCRVTCHTQEYTTIVPSVHGLILYELYSAKKLVIYNPCTRRSITLPMLDSNRTDTNYYLGYDPIGNEYKVLACSIMRTMPKPRKARRGLAKEIHVLTVGSGDSSWRMIQGNIPHHSPISQDLCINGVLYYLALTGEKLDNHAIMSFDVRSEKLHLIKGPCMFGRTSKLTSYDGKLAVFLKKNWKNWIVLWVLEDAAKEEWSKKTFVFLPYIYVWNRLLTTDDNTGEIIIARAACVIYYDVKKTSVRRVYIEGICRGYDALSFSSQVENLMFL